MDTLAKKILVDFEVIDAQAKAELKALTKDIGNLRKAISDAEKDWINMKFALESVGVSSKEQQDQIDALQKKLNEERKAIDEGKEAIIEYRKEQEKFKTAQQESKAAIEEHKRELAASRVEVLNAKKAVLQHTEALEKQRAKTEENRTQITALTLKTKQEAEARREATKNYVAAAGSYDEANAKLKELGKNIKSAEGGFLSQNDAIKAQIKEYNELNDKLKAFDTQMGNNQRRTGGYSQELGAHFDTLNHSISQITRELPAFANSAQTGFMAISNNIPQFFDELKKMNRVLKESAAASAIAIGDQAKATAIAGGASEEAATQIGDLAKEQALAAAEGKRGREAFKAVAQSLVSFGSLLNFAVVALTVFGPKIVDFIAGLFKGKDALDKAKHSLIELNNALASTDYTNAIENVNRLKIDIGLARDKFLEKSKVLNEYNRTIGETTGKVKTLDEAEKALIRNANEYIKMQLYKAVATNALQDASKKAYEAVLESNKPHEKDYVMDPLNMAKEQLHGIMNMATGGSYEKGNANLKQRKEQAKQEAIKDANDQKDMFLGIAKDYEKKAAEIAKKMGFDFFNGGQDDKTKKKGNGLANRRADAYAASEEMLKTSQGKELQLILDSYAKEVLSADQHYNEQVFKLDGYLRKKLITQAEYDKVEKQLKQEHETAIQQITIRFQREDAQRVTDLQNEIVALQNESIRNQTQKELANLEQQTKLKLQALDRQDAMLQDEINRSELAVEKLHGKEQDEERRHLAVLNDQLQQSYTKRGLIITNGEKSAQDIKRAARDKVISEVDEARVLDSDRPRNEREHFKAVMTKLDDDWKREVENAERIGADVALINAKYRKQQSDLENQENERQVQKVRGYAEAGANLALGVLRNSLQASSSARMQSLSDAKSRELANTSLTGSQKAAIEEKYRRLELKEKVKAFRAQQKLDTAQALVSGALAMLKIKSQTGLLGFVFDPIIAAQTAASVALIAAQKPPAYALGGVHSKNYNSDGRGGVLPGYSRKDNVNAYLREGEGVVVSEAMRNPFARQMVSDVNVAFGGRAFGGNMGHAFAGGGMFSNTYLPTVGNPAQYRPVVQQSINYDMLAASMSRVNLMVGVRDISYQQAVIAQTENRANL